MLLLLIPVGNGNLIYNIFAKLGYNGTLLDDGIFFVITGLLILACVKQLSLSVNDKNVSISSAIAVGVSSIFFVSLSGLSFVVGVFAIMLLFGVNKKSSIRYSLVMSVPILVVMGIIELCTASVSAGVLAIILGLIIAAAVSFISVKVLQWIINSNKLKFFGVYDIGIGVICAVIGVFELILK
jgi:undecaprenyl pyrophosphate phosphatase UppP